MAECTSVQVIESVTLVMNQREAEALSKLLGYVTYSSDDLIKIKNELHNVIPYDNVRHKFHVTFGYNAESIEVTRKIGV